MCVIFFGIRSNLKTNQVHSKRKKRKNTPKKIYKISFAHSNTSHLNPACYFFSYQQVQGQYTVEIVINIGAIFSDGDNYSNDVVKWSTDGT